MTQEPTLQTISDSLQNLTLFLHNYKKDTDHKFEAVAQRFDTIDKKFNNIDYKFDNNFKGIAQRSEDLTGIMINRFDSIDNKFEDLTEIMIENFDRVEKKLDDTRIELKREF